MAYDTLTENTLEDENQQYTGRKSTFLAESKRFSSVNVSHRIVVIQKKTATCVIRKWLFLDGGGGSRTRVP